MTALIKWALDVNRNSNLPVLVGNPLFLVNISCIHFMSILLKPPFFSWQGWNLSDIGFRGPKAQHYNDVLVISYSWQDHARQGHANLEISNTNSRNWVFSPSPLKARRKVLKLCDQLIVHCWEDLWIIQDKTPFPNSDPQPATCKLLPPVSRFDALYRNKHCVYMT